MAIPGDPFHTKALDGRRAAQRRVLRGISTWVVVRHAVTPVTVPSNESPTFIEAAVRDEVDKLLEAEQFTALLDHMAVAERQGALCRFLDENSMRRPFESDELSDVRHESYEAARVHGVHQLEPKQSSELRTLLTLLVWADQLAGDYEDPRVVRAGETTAARN